LSDLLWKLRSCLRQYWSLDRNSHPAPPSMAWQGATPFGSVAITPKIVALGRDCRWIETRQ
jgi:hypothetical protein